ncbi:hypothetical protein N9A04_00290 [Rickettsiales bacterium]|nr:hypothetical protein [Rickettsiales bacterium]
MCTEESENKPEGKKDQSQAKIIVPLMIVMAIFAAEEAIINTLPPKGTIRALYIIITIITIAILECQNWKIIPDAFKKLASIEKMLIIFAIQYVTLTIAASMCENGGIFTYLLGADELQKTIGVSAFTGNNIFKYCFGATTLQKTIEVSAFTSDNIFKYWFGATTLKEHMEYSIPIIGAILLGLSPALASYSNDRRTRKQEKEKQEQEKEKQKQKDQNFNNGLYIMVQLCYESHYGTRHNMQYTIDGKIRHNMKDQMEYTDELCKKINQIMCDNISKIDKKQMKLLTDFTESMKHSNHATKIRLEASKDNPYAFDFSQSNPETQRKFEAYQQYHLDNLAND